MADCEQFTVTAKDVDQTLKKVQDEVISGVVSETFTMAAAPCRSGLAIPSEIASLSSLEPKHAVVLDPLTHPGWDSLVEAHPGSSIFHSRAWARVLHETYRHRPFYFCRLANGQLKELLAVMVVSSPWTGARDVSLPFSDFCGMLRTAEADGARLYNLALETGRQRKWRYLECKSNHRDWSGSSPALVFYGHVIDLDRRLQTILDGFQSATRRSLRRAEAAGLHITFDNSLRSMRTFYSLHSLTRRRHGLPPPGFGFFEKISRHVLAPGHGFIVTAYAGVLPVAAAVYFHQGRRAIFKFGASDYAFQNLRPNNLVMWEAIKRYAADGFTSLHLGRTSVSNHGLRRYKLGFGAREERIEHCRFDFRKRAFTPESHRVHERFCGLFRCLPFPLFRLAGRIIYPHIG